MRHFRNPKTNMLHAYDVDGTQDDLIKAAVKAGWPEEGRPSSIGERPDPRYVKIAELEASVTPRRLREAVLGDADAMTFVSKVDAKIKKLREKM